MGKEFATDYLVVGAGAMGMAFTDVLLSESDATITIVDSKANPGGHWNDAYPFVRLHQPSSFYGVNSTPLGGNRKDLHGGNAGLYELASGTELVTYFDQLMNRRFLPSGRVRYLPVSEFLGDGQIRNLVSGATTNVEAKKTVDATYMNVTVPSVTPPKYDVAEDVWCVPLNDLPELVDLPEEYVVVGGGKTAIDACLWLLDNGVDDDCDGEEDEFLNRLGLILSNYDKSSGTVFLENGNIYDGPKTYSSIPVTWDSANESFEISVYGIQSSVDAVITWSMSGYSLEANTSQDGKTVIMMPINCRDTEENMQIQFCDEGSSIQKLKAVVSEDGYYTEVEWNIMVTIWVEPQSENWLFSIISSPKGLIGIVTFLIALSAGGFLIGLRISRAKELQDALEAYGVSPERLAISPENKGMVLPSAPDVSWSNDENS